MDQATLSQYRDSLLGAAQIAAPTPMVDAPTPSDLTSTFQHLGSLSQSSSNGEAARHALLGTGGAANAIQNQQDAATKIALQEKQDQLAAIDQQKKDMLDPSKYRQTIANDGGYNFFDPQGNPIDIKQFSAATGKHTTDVLKGSQNPNDQEFVRNYKNVEKVGQIFQSGSKQQKDKFLKENPDVQGDYNLLKKSLGREPTYGDIVSAFRSGYSKFFNTQAPIPSQKTTYGNKTLSDIKGS